jgi:DNA-binding NarL/FixJ family response regulator
MPVSILVVDDHPLFREALQLAIRSAYPEANIVESPSIAAAKIVLAGGATFDLVLLDLAMPGTKGFDGLLELRSINPKQPIVIVSALEDPRIIHEAMTCGAAGYISKSVRKPELTEAIQDVMNGLVYLPKGYEPPPPGQGAADSDLASRLATLTPQQIRVLNMLRQGLLNKQIAYELGVGETTVKAHVSEILRKIGVASRTQAVIEVSKIDFDAILGAVHTAPPQGTSPRRGS